LCAPEPAGAARVLVDGGFTSRYDYALQTLSENLYYKSRASDPEDAKGLYRLRLHDIGVIKIRTKSSPITPD